MAGDGGELQRKVDAWGTEVDDLLHTLWLVRHNGPLAEALFDRLSHVLLHGLFLELHHKRAAGSITEALYEGELTALVEQCRAVGLMPLSSMEE